MKSRLFIFLVILALSLSACVSLAEDITPPPNAQPPAPAATEPPAPADEAPAQGVDGADLFAENCAACHGSDGTGVATAADLTDGARMGIFPDEMLAAIIANGSGSGMPAFGDELSETEIWVLIAHLRGIATDETPVDEEPAPDIAETPLDEEDVAEAEQDEAEDVAVTAISEGIGTISGIVMNGSGGELIPDLTVELHAYDHDLMTGGFNEVFTLEVPVNADGSYIFDDVEMPAERAFVAVIDLGVIAYASEPGFSTEGVTNLDLLVTMYDTSSDTSLLSVDRLHIFLEFPDPDVDIVQVVEVFVVTNTSLMTIVPAAEGEPTITFRLPDGATNIQFEDGAFGERYTQSIGGFGDTAPIQPGVGQHQVIVFFEMPFDRKTDFTQPIEMPIDSAIIMAPDGIKIKSDLLQESGQRDAEGLVYNVFSSQPLPIGVTLTMNISGKMKDANSGITGIDSQQNIIFGAGALGLTFIIVGIWLFMRNRNEEDYDYDDDDDEEYDDDEVEFDNANEIMDAIIALDDAYRAGDLSEEIYKKRRAELKAQLKDLV